MPALTVEQVLSGSALGLVSGLGDLLVVEFGERRVLYALSRSELRLIEVEIAADGTQSVAGAIPVAGPFAAGSQPLLGQVWTAAGEMRLTLAGLPAANGQSVTLAPDGALGNQAAIPGAATLVAPAGLDLGGTPAMISGRAGAGGLDLFTDTGSGLSWRAGLDDTTDRNLADVAASVAFEIGLTDYVATVSATENGLNIVGAGTATLVQSGALGNGEGLPVGLPTDLDVVQRLNETLLVIAASGSSSLSVVSVAVGGVPILADHVLDSPGTYFQSASAVAAIAYGDFAYVAAGGGEGGLSLFTLLPGGRLVHVASLADDATTTLYRISDIELAIAGSALQIYGSSLWEAGLTRISHDLSGLGAVVVADGTGAAVTGTSADDQLIGSAVGDAIAGGAGADILFDGAGSDVLTGGGGADLFVLHPDGVSDLITDFQRGTDKLDLSAFDFLYDIGQLSIVPTSTGATLSHGNEVIHLTTSDALPLTAGELTNADILNVDRPPLLAVGQTISGGLGPDVLNGGAGPDTIQGAGGDDLLFGQFGADSITGGAGADAIDGGGGDDILRGQSEADTLAGGEGNDLIFGDAGDDVIYGDDFDWPMI